MLLALRIALSVGLAAHVSFFFFDKVVFGDFDSYQILWNTGFAIASERTEGWEYLFTLINAVWFYGLAFGVVAAFLMKAPSQTVEYMSDPVSSVPPGIND